MAPKQVDFREEVMRFSPGIIALLGGGGKTTLLLALGRSVAKAGGKALGVTTTRLRRPGPEDAAPFLLQPDPARIRFSGPGFVLAARPAPPGGDQDKVYGYAPEEVDALLARDVAPWIIVEADGAAGRPLKAPATHEPVVPSRTGVAVAVIGLGGLGRPLHPATVFRPERAAAVTGLLPGDIVTPDAVAAMVTHEAGLFKNTPPGAARLLFCNQADLPGAEKSGKALAAVLAHTHPGFLRGIYLGAVRGKGLACLSLPVA